MLPLNEFILLKSLYNEQLQNAVLAKDGAQIEAIVHERYAIDLRTGYVSLEAIDTEQLYKDHMEQLSNKQMLKRLK